jgi:hypothetical protein
MSLFVRKPSLMPFLMAFLLFAIGVSAQEEDATSTTDEETFVSAEKIPDCGEVPPRGGQGHVIIKTKPQKAVVYLGGTKLGLSPIDTTFSSGRHTLTIMLNGEELVTKRLNVCPDQTTEFSKELKMPYGSIAVKTKPIKINAKVWIDGQEVGNTKGGILRVNHLEAGTRVVKIVYGHKVREVNVDVLAEESVDVPVSF